jgi:two-component system, NtrC family, sensor kinase
MHISLAPLIFTLLLTQRLFNFSKLNNNQKWVNIFRYARYFALFLFVAEIVLQASETFRWIWNIILISLIVYIYKHRESPYLRMYLLAFTPYVLITFISDSAELIAKDFYYQWSNYFVNATILSVIWLLAILFSQYRQSKAALKERIKRQKEDEINRAIAMRKVELEGLVAERTMELTHQKEELENALKELKATQAQLIQSEKMASLGELTAGIAHEIQNPLNFVNNFSELSSELLDEMKEELLKKNTDEAAVLANDVKQNLEKIIHHGKRADSIVKGMLQHSRSNMGIKEPTDINALADEYLRLSYHGLRAKDKSFNADFKLEADETLQKVDVVPQDIGRVLLNLINNAFYAVSKKAAENIPGYKPEVTVSTKRSNKNVKISIKDNGSGVPVYIKDKIFQPFFTTKPAGQGTGLGLSISYDIITKGHNGDITINTKQGEGTEFVITIPIEK